VKRETAAPRIKKGQYPWRAYVDKVTFKSNANEVLSDNIFQKVTTMKKITISEKIVPMTR
jgi:hypothetical protein